MFFICVIGGTWSELALLFYANVCRVCAVGYYQPNYQLVIGTGALNWFEELVELLGQVKQPTATK
ncbi:hypothetical protein EI94DRAFT_1718319 [Lactarius quietus]|nr:hypothetical protein EI94DRAFT_1720060 [Lactarius quietus]KAF8272584.1 hypothetical protein EI94DRAFT_1718319 [Lactarius quietus]